jgi:CHAT domain-containing protein
MASDHRAAETSLEQSLELARRIDDQVLVSNILLKLATARFRSREFNDCLALAEEAIAAARRTGDRRVEAWALEQAGNALYSIGRFANALEYFLSAVSLMREAGDRTGEAAALKDSGILCKYLRRYDEAFSYMNQALEIFRELDDSSGIVSTLHNIGSGYAMLDADRLALEAYEEALKVCREKNDLTGACHVLTRIGYLVGNKELGTEYLYQALTLAEELKLYDLQVEALNGLSEVLAETGQLDRAIAMQNRALEINLRWNKRSSVELNGLGHLFLERDPAMAASYFRRSLIAAVKESDAPLVISPHYGLGRAHSRLGELDLAIEHYQRAIDAIESIRTRLASDEHKATFSGQYQRIYNGLIEALMERHQRDPNAGDDARAFTVLERAKARSLVEAITEGRLGVSEDVNDDLGRREKELNARIAELQKELILPELPKEERLELSQQLSVTEQELERLRVEMKRRNPRYAGLTYPEPLSVGEAQRMLDHQTAIVAYALMKENVIAFTITSSAFRAERLSVRADIVRARVQNYIDLINREENTGWQDTSRCLYSELVAPILNQLPPGIRRLVLIPDDVLHHLPFETLIRDGGASTSEPAIDSTINPSVANQSSPRYLLEDFTISYAPSATVLAELVISGSDSAPPPGSVAVFADPALASVLLPQVSPRDSETIARSLYAEEGLLVSPIPFSAAEAAAIERYAGPGSEIRTGAEASESRIKAASLDRFSVLHFATHGFISQRMPARSALALAPANDEDGFLQVREICQLKLQSDLVVLSGCQTARGQVLGGEGARGLAQAFFHAGAMSVVASLWDVNDESTTLFMDAFYRQLSGHKSKAEALRAAKLELLRQRRTASPRYWAAFILIGEADRSVSIGRAGWSGGWSIAVAAVSIVLGAMFLAFRRVKHKRSS